MDTARCEPGSWLKMTGPDRVEHNVIVGWFGDVIHRTKKHGICRENILVATRGREISLIAEPVSSEHAAQIIARAESMVGDPKYNFLSDNCQHFASWCFTGIAESYQLRDVGRAGVATMLVGDGWLALNSQLNDKAKMYILFASGVFGWMYFAGLPKKSCEMVLS